MRQYTIKSRMVSVGRDYDVLDEAERIVFVIDGKVRFGRTFVIKDDAGLGLIHAREILMSLDTKFRIERDGETIATVLRTGDPLAVSPKFEVEIAGQAPLRTSGSFFRGGVSIQSGEGLVGRVARTPNTVLREIFSVSIAETRDQPLVLAIAMCIIEMTPDRGKEPAP